MHPITLTLLYPFVRINLVSFARTQSPCLPKLLSNRSIPYHSREREIPRELDLLFLPGACGPVGPSNELLGMPRHALPSTVWSFVLKMHRGACNFRIMQMPECNATLLEMSTIIIGIIMRTRRLFFVFLEAYVTGISFSSLRMKTS